MLNAWFDVRSSLGIGDCLPGRYGYCRDRDATFQFAGSKAEKPPLTGCEHPISWAFGVVVWIAYLGADVAIRCLATLGR